MCSNYANSRLLEVRIRSAQLSKNSSIDEAKFLVNNNENLLHLFHGVVSFAVTRRWHRRVSVASVTHRCCSLKKSLLHFDKIEVTLSRNGAPGYRGSSYGHRPRALSSPFLAAFSRTLRGQNCFRS